MKYNKLKIGFLYLIMTAGGLWHILSYFQSFMKVAAGPLLILVGLWLFSEHLFSGQLEGREKAAFSGWAGAVFIISFFIEMVGVRTGVIFGAYDYGPVLQPQFIGVPLAIGAAWFIMLFSSAAVMQKLRQERPFLKPAGQIFIIALLMTFFDFIMEPAAVKLNYWTWEGAPVPVQNYLAWFITGLALAALGQAMQIFRRPLPPLAFHAFVAQLIYFILIILS